MGTIRRSTPTRRLTRLRAPGDFVDNHDIIACVSQHDGDENQPYEQAANGEVAATNRPKLRPTIASIGLSPIGDLHTFKIGFGYATDAWYSNPNDLFDPLFPASLTDPQLLPFPSNSASFVEVDARADQPGVRRVNDIDVSGEQYSPFDADTADHGQVQVFRKAGDPYSFCVAPDNCGGSLGVGHLLAFDAQGDLPISWTVKASLAPESYKRTVKFDFDDFAAWYKSWQDYYNGGPKPTMPLAPGTNPPARDPNLTVLNTVAVTAGQTAGTTTSTVTTIIQQSGSGGAARSTEWRRAAKSSIRSAKVIRTKTGKRLVVFVKSTKADRPHPDPDVRRRRPQGRQRQQDGRHQPVGEGQRPSRRQGEDGQGRPSRLGPSTVRQVGGPAHRRALRTSGAGRYLVATVSVCCAPALRRPSPRARGWSRARRSA